jgi:hypothetical protein
VVELGGDVANNTQLNVAGGGVRRFAHKTAISRVLFDFQHFEVYA